MGRVGVTVRWSGQLSVKDDFLVARSARQAGHERGGGGFSGLFGEKGKEEEEEWEGVGDGGGSPSPSTGPPAEQ